MAVFRSNPVGMVKYLFGIALLVFAAYWLYSSEEYREVLTGFSLMQVAISSLFAILIFALSGVQLAYLIKRSQGRLISFVDTITLPSAMSLWGFILPFQGATLYSLAFLKLKYSVNLSSGIAVSLFSYLVTISLTGIIGVCFLVATANLVSPIGGVAMLFALAPLFSMIVERLLNGPVTAHFPKFPLLRRIKDIVTPTNRFWFTGRVALYTVLLNVLHIALTVAWYWWLAKTIGVEATLAQVTFLTLIAKLSIIVRLTPGNIGVDQVVSGAAMALLGGAAEVGVALSLLATFTVIFVSLISGGLATLYNLRYFSLKQIWSR